MTSFRPLHFLVLFSPILLFVALPWWTGQTFFHEDIAFYFHGLRGLLREAPSQWNPWISCGLPLVGDLQSATFYPLSFPYRMWEVEGALMFSITLHLVLGSWFWVRWLGSWRLDPWAVVFSGLVWLWSGFFWNHLHHLTFLTAGVWIPALLWSIDVTRGAARVSLVWPAACLGMMWLAGGSPQLAVYGTWLGIFYGVIGARAEGLPLRRGLMDSLLVVAGGVALAWVVIWPGYLAAQARYVEVTTYVRSTEFSLSPLALGRLLVPQLFGNPFSGRGYEGFSAFWEEAPSVGLLTLPLIFMARGVAAGWRRPFFGAVALVGFLGMFGTLGGVHAVLYHLLPGYGLFRAPNRIHLLFTLGAAVLSALTLDRLGRGQLKEESLRAAKYFVILGGEGLLLCGLYLGMKEVLPTFLPRAGLVLAVGVVAAGGYFLKRVGEGKIEPGRVTAWATVLLMVELVPNTAVFNRPMGVEEVQRRSAMEQFLGEHPPQGRLMVDDSAGPAWLNAGMDLHVPTVRGYNPLNPMGMARLMAIADGRPPHEIRSGISLGLEDLQSPVLNLLSPSLWLSRLDAEELPPGLEPLFTEGDLTLYQNPAALPRWFFPGPVRVVEDPDVRAEVIREAASQRPVPLVLDESPGEGLVGSCPEGTVELLQEGPDRVITRVFTEGPCFLAWTTTFAQGWSATVDSYPTQLVRGWEALQVVWIPTSGHHVVALNYETPGLAEAKWISALAWGCVLLGGLRLRREGGQR